ncbi:MAG: hypothetical protein ACK4K2_04660 [Dehalococcoidia bacterium]
MTQRHFVRKLSKELAVAPSGDAQADRIINGKRTEKKFSTLWASGVFKFQQIRDQDYSQLFLLGLAPFGAAAWVIPKSVLAPHFTGQLQLEGLTQQHGGRKGRDTWWLSFPANSRPDWLSPYGGTLAKVLQLL